MVTGSNFLGHFRPPPPPSPLKSDIINGRSLALILVAASFHHDAKIWTLNLALDAGRSNKINGN